MKKGFTLIELLVSISIIGILFSIALPAISRAMDFAKTTSCASNLRAVSIGLEMYVADGYGRYPAASGFANGSDSADGYITWAGLLGRWDYLASDALQCPACINGGVPPANPSPGKLADGQQAESFGVRDIAPQRISYTVNEAVCGKFCVGNPRRKSRYVLSDIVDPGVILATELADDWRLLANRSDICRSYLPVHGFYVKAVSAGSKFDLNSAGNPGSKPCLKDGAYSRVELSQIQAQPSADRINPSPLDWIGRNHGIEDDNGFMQSNFVYTDGHVEALHLPETLYGLQWGKCVYSITGDNRVN